MSTFIHEDGNGNMLNDQGNEVFAVDMEVVLKEMIDNLTSKFEDLSISKTALYNFVAEKCRISLKKAHFHSVERNSPKKIQERHDWVVKWNETDLGFTRARAVVVVPKTTTILGAISPYGVVNIKVRKPRVLIPSKKRKTADKHEQFKGNYIVMDNAPIHKNTDIRKYIEQHGYGCVYLPAYSPELNPIEQFWSVCKSKLKREKLLQEETLSSRIGEACNTILLSDLQGFCRYSAAKFEDCLNRKPM
ncbi:hypothetical protein G6F56_008958 [Rhizopus delemar]|nr:hypothetical protein G6F56_008958 [Rhizopus delemar]